ncbi:MAG TPA: hypothetical protein VF593_00965 [Chthoniobacteraceae bacterium]
MVPETPQSGLALELLELIRCPLTMQKLRLATPAELAGIEPPLEGALLREDGAMLYPIRSGIPILLAEEAILTKR